MFEECPNCKNISFPPRASLITMRQCHVCLYTETYSLDPSIEWDIDANLPMYTRDYLKMRETFKNGLTSGIVSPNLARISLSEIRDDGVWLCYHYDWSGIAVFNNELDALRHATANKMEVRFQSWGEVSRD